MGGSEVSAHRNLMLCPKHRDFLRGGRGAATSGLQVWASLEELGCARQVPPSRPWPRSEGARWRGGREVSGAGIGTTLREPPTTIGDRGMGLREPPLRFRVADLHG